MDENGVMLKDTITPDGHYVTAEGKRVSYMPGWFQDKDGWRYIQKNGYYLANTWYQDTDGKYYYFNMAAIMAVNTDIHKKYKQNHHKNLKKFQDNSPSSASSACFTGK